MTDPNASEPAASDPSAEGASTFRLGWGGKLLALLLFFVVPLALRAYPLEHGGERGYVPDAHIVRSALGMAQERNPVPPVGRFSTYPNLLPYMLLPIYAGQYFLGQGEEWLGAEEFGQHVLMNPSSVHHPARWLIAILASLTPLVIFAAAREAGLRRGAWIGAWLVTTGLLHAQFSTQERPWAPMALFMACSAWMSVRYVQRGRQRDLLFSGLAAGLAYATHQAGLLTLGLAGLAWLIGPRQRVDFGTRLRRGVWTVVGFALVGFLIGHPYLLVHGSTQTDAVVGGEALKEAGGMSIGGMSVVFQLSMDTFRRLSWVLVGYDPAVLLLGLLGLFGALRKRELLPTTLWTLAWAAVFLTYTSDHARYLLPLTVLLAIPAAVVSESLLKNTAGKVVVALALALASVQVVRFALVLERADTRAEGEEALYELPFGTRVAIDRYGPAAEMDAESLVRLQELRSSRGSGLYARERHRKNELLAGALAYEDEGLDLIPIADLFAFDERAETVVVHRGLEEYGQDPESVLTKLEVTHLVLVKRRVGEEHLLEFLVQGKQPIQVIDPSPDGQAPEAFLPTEMDFPLTALWQVNRPGPRLEIYELE